VNVAKNIKQQLNLFNYLNGQINTLKKCVTDYIEEKGSGNYKQFLQEWLKYGVTLLTHNTNNLLNNNCISKFILPDRNEILPDMNEVYPLFYHSSFKNYVLSYPTTLETIQLFHNRDKITECDDETILAVHKNKPCIDDMFGCILCEDMEYRWHNKLIKSYRHSNNIFINPDLQVSFITEWVEANPTYHDFKFPPTKCYDIDWLSNTYSTKSIITDYKLALINAIESRNHYNNKGETPLECLQKYTINQTIESSLSRIKLDKTSDFELFMYLWNHLDLFHVYIKLDSERCNEILEML